MLGSEPTRDEGTVFEVLGSDMGATLDWLTRSFVVRCSQKRHPRTMVPSLAKRWSLLAIEISSIHQACWPPAIIYHVAL
jgi:hypothetical protein